MQQMFDSLPAADQARFQKEAMAILGNPEADGYDTSGQPIYTAETMARCSGIPIEEIEAQSKSYNQIFGEVEVDEKVTVLKQPETAYQVSASGVVILSLMEWTDGNEAVIPMLTQWFDLAIKHGSKPIVIQQLKQLINKPGWDNKAADRYLTRIYQYASAEEFLIDIMGIETV